MNLGKLTRAIYATAGLALCPNISSAEQDNCIDEVLHSATLSSERTKKDLDYILETIRTHADEIDFPLEIFSTNRNTDIKIMRYGKIKELRESSMRSYALKAPLTGGNSIVIEFFSGDKKEDDEVTITTITSKIKTIYSDSFADGSLNSIYSENDSGVEKYTLLDWLGVFQSGISGVNRFVDFDEIEGLQSKYERQVHNIREYVENNFP